MSFNAISRHVIWDEALVLHDGAAAITADGIGQYSSADRYVDLGTENISSAAVQPGGADMWGVMMIDVSAIDVVGGDELYWVLLQASSSATFASDINTIAAFPLGDAAVMPGGADNDVGVGQHVIPFRTWATEADPLRHHRVWFDVTGATASITAIVRLGLL